MSETQLFVGARPPLLSASSRSRWHLLAPLPRRRLNSFSEHGHLSHPKSQRRFFPPFSLCGYSFSLLADPTGNPRAANQGLAGGARVEKGLSVYLTVLFEEELLDTPPWSGGGNGSFSGYVFPPPPLQLGPGHPWGAEEEEEDGGAEEHQGDPHHQEKDGAGEASEGENSALHASGTAAPAKEDGDGDAVAAAAAAAAADGAAKPAAVAVKRDPHGLRRRRRRARTREGRAPVVSLPSAISRECCAAFSLTALNKDSRKDVTWVSSMKRDRFFPGRSSWGVHCLVPTSTFQVAHACFFSLVSNLHVCGRPSHTTKRATTREH